MRSVPVPSFHGTFLTGVGVGHGVPMGTSLLEWGSATGFPVGTPLPPQELHASPQAGAQREPVSNVQQLSRERRQRPRNSRFQFEAFVGDLLDANAPALRRFLAAKLDTGCRPTSVRTYLGAIRPFYTWAFERGLIDAERRLRLPCGGRVRGVGGPLGADDWDLLAGRNVGRDSHLVQQTSHLCTLHAKVRSSLERASSIPEVVDVTWAGLLAGLVGRAAARCPGGYPRNGTASALGAPGAQVQEGHDVVGGNMYLPLVAGARRSGSRPFRFDSASSTVLTNAW